MNKEKITEEEAVKIINSIAKRYPELRQNSKPVTFSSLYSGTYIAIQEQLGCTEVEAKAIESNYHKMHKVTDDWVDAHIKQASIQGYVPLAFGGRLYTPVLSQVVYGKTMSYKAHEEKRSAGNALMQSYCMLTVRAMTEFMQRVRDSKYRLDIRGIATIHDSIYLIVKNNIGCLKWVNDNLISCMAWQELDELKHPSIGFTAECDIHYPDWSKAITIPNGATKLEIMNICKGD